MPHFIVEHSANLNSRFDMQQLADGISETCQGLDVFPLAGIRVRMHPVTICAIGDGHENNAFVAVIMRIGAGRDLETRQRSGQLIYDYICEFFKTDIEAGFMAVSVDIEINDPEMTFKRNGIAARLAKETQA